MQHSRPHYDAELHCLLAPGVANHVENVGQKSGQLFRTCTIRGNILDMLYICACKSVNANHDEIMGQKSGYMCRQ